MSPRCPDRPELVVAAGRAGALGVFDLGPSVGLSNGFGAVEAAARFLGERAFGVRLDGNRWDDELVRSFPRSVRVVWVTTAVDGDWATTLGRLRHSGRLVVAEVRAREDAWAAAAAGCDGLVLAGHEAGGRGGEESSYILLQATLARPVPPVWVRGGVGPRVAAACVAMGARGVVLEGALLLARESPLDELARERIRIWDGSETLVIGRSTGEPVRVYAPPGDAVLERLRQAEGAGAVAWQRAVDAHVGWGRDQAWPIGPEAAWAARLASRCVTAGGIVQAFETAVEEGIEQAVTHRPLAEEGSALAVAHGTRYPIVQGPMTRVSDTAEFARAVAEGGALPFLALAMMRRAEVKALLEDAKARLGERSWGVGLLGFLPPELRREQTEEILKARPPFALIAGGRPDQSAALERDGIATYLHVPSPGLLRQYLGEGARRFVLEGRECGGHVGPRSSFVLWEQAVEVIEQAVDRGLPAEALHVLFAGGIHDGRSAAGVAAICASIAARGVKVGVLVGTAYLFTTEAVSTGAIVPRFQAEAVACSRTVLLETGPGHEVRVCPSPFTEAFQAERRRLLGERRPAAEIREVLEGLNVGRLRVATKGVDRGVGEGASLAHVTEPEQVARGLYMLGQVATLRQEITTIGALHRELTEGSAAWLDRVANAGPVAAAPPPPRPSDVAIVGMAAIAPGAGDVRTFWENTLRGVDAITEVPEDRWNWRLYYDPDPKAPDKIISKWGGFLPDVPFDPLRYGMPPTSLPSIEPMHLLTLEAVRAALDDAGYGQRPFVRERTAVVLGAGGGAAQLAMGYAFRSYLPLLDTVLPGGGREALERCGAALPEWTEDSFPGILLNVAAGRVANRFDLGGANYTVDAACGSSLAAASLAVRELETGAADMVILGGADTVQNPFTYLAFSKTHAFSPRGRCRPFDASADGIVISEGVAVLVLKRLADAERDGDRIYAVIKGLGASSDGRARGLTAPRPEGQVRALRRAYEKAGVSPATVGYVEAHGTGTAAGDLSEVESLTSVFREAGAA
ncbi:MAG: beta-ketoacyl synthase N-terminal-like domain-containing protein, partial [Isosphaeraceae bacterium]|nr:beta-ketoacyl synthase N-terminal-like domain-containing protein [Isosphaeraceae bacterium]